MQLASRAFHGELEVDWTAQAVCERGRAGVVLVVIALTAKISAKWIKGERRNATEENNQESDSQYTRNPRILLLLHQFIQPLAPVLLHPFKTEPQIYGQLLLRLGVPLQHTKPP